MTRARLLVLAGAILWGTTGTAQALGPPGTTPATVGAVRILLGGAVLLVLARGTLPGNLRALRANWAAVLAAAVGVAAYQVAFFAAVERTGVALGTVVGIGSAPAMTGALAWLVRRERPEPGWGTATALAVVGCALLLSGSGGAAVDPLGVLLAFGAGASYAAYTLAGKRLLDAGVAPTAAMAAVFAGGALLLLPLLWGADVSWLASGAGVVTALWLGVMTTAVAYVCFARGLRRLPAATVATISLAEPLTAGLLGVLLLGERPGRLAVLGGLLIAGGLVALLVRRPLTSGATQVPTPSQKRHKKTP